MLDNAEMIRRLDAILYIDVICWECKREAALSNTVEREGRRYCYRCVGLAVGGPTLRERTP